MEIGESLKSRMAKLELNKVGVNRPGLPAENRRATYHPQFDIPSSDRNSEVSRINQNPMLTNNFRQSDLPIKPIPPPRPRPRPNSVAVLPEIRQVNLPKLSDQSLQNNDRNLNPFRQNLSSHITPLVISNPATQMWTNFKDACLACQDFSLVDAHASKFPRTTVTSLKNLSRDLTSPFASHTEKARAIFIWLHHNIAYDTIAYFSGNTKKCKTPEETLRSGLAICHGYAELFQTLGRYSGLEVEVISGHGKGYGYKSPTTIAIPPFEINHAWNAVRLDGGVWHLIDSCWGAGTVDSASGFTKQLNTKYFTSSPETFRRKHFPHNPAHQLYSTQISWEEYIRQKEGPLIYTDFNEMEFNEDTIQPSRRIIFPAPTRFIITTKCEHVGIVPPNRYILLLSVDDEDLIPFSVDPMGKIWTCAIASLRPNSEVSVNVVKIWNGNDAKGLSVQEFLNSKDKVSWSWQGLCKWNVSS